MDGASWACFCCCRSPVHKTNVMIFLVRSLECLCAQHRPRFILSVERVLGSWVRTYVHAGLGLYSQSKEYWGAESEPMSTPSEKSSQPDGFGEGRIRDAPSRRIASPTHCQLRYSGLMQEASLALNLLRQSPLSPPPPPPPPSLSLSSSSSSIQIFQSVPTFYQPSCHYDYITLIFG